MRNDKAARLCIAAEKAEGLEKARLFRKAEVLDAESHTKRKARAILREQRKIYVEAGLLQKQAAAADNAGEHALAREMRKSAHELSVDHPLAEDGLTRQSTISRKAESAEREVQEEYLSRMGMGPSDAEQTASSNEWTCCLDRPFVQMEIRWARQYKKVSTPALSVVA